MCGTASPTWVRGGAAPLCLPSAWVRGVCGTAVSPLPSPPLPSLPLAGVLSKNLDFELWECLI